MTKKVISILLSIVIIISLCTILQVSADEWLRSPVMNKDYYALKSELSGFINSARGVMAKDDMTPKLWQTEKLNERYLQARELSKKHRNAPETMENIIELENFLLGLFGGWDPEWNNGDGTFGAYIGKNLPYSPTQNAMCVSKWALGNYLMNDPEYGIAKLIPVIGQVTDTYLVEKKPEVIINVDGEEIVARGAKQEAAKDTNGAELLIRQSAYDKGILTNPGQYTHESWYAFAKKVSELMRMCVVTPEFNGQSELQQTFATRSYMQKQLDGYRAAYDALELIPSETDASVSDAQKAEARQKNRLQSILRMMLEVWPHDAAEANYYFNDLACKFDVEQLLSAQDGSSTPLKMKQTNQWYESHELSYEIDLDTSNTLKEKVRAWIAAAKQATDSAEITTDELLQYINIKELYTDKNGDIQYVDGAENPDQIRLENKTWIDYRYILNTILENFSNNIMSANKYKQASDAILSQANTDCTMQRYNTIEGKAAYNLLIKTGDEGNKLLEITDRFVTETEYWNALENIMAAYEALLPLRAKHYETLDGVLLGIAEGTTARELILNLRIDGTFYFRGIQLKDTDIIRTGSILQSNGAELFSVSVTADVNGDGKISLADVTLIAKHTAGISQLQGAYLKAGDVNRDGTVRLSDVTQAAMHVAGIKKIN